MRGRIPALARACAAFLLLLPAFAPTMDVAQTTATLVGVVLPSDAQPGEKVSGSLVIDPKKYAGIPALRVVEMELALPRGEGGKATLEGLVIDPGDGRPQRADEIFIVDIPRNVDRIPIVVRREGSPAPLVRRDLPIGQTRPAGTTRPVDFRTSPLCSPGGVHAIRGPLDGDGRATDVRVNDQKSTVIAETPRAVYFVPAADTPAGSARVTLAEGQRRVSFSLAVVRLRVSADRLQLLKGEQTAYHVEVSGPEALPPSAWRGGVDADLTDLSEIARIAPPGFRVPTENDPGTILFRVENASPEVVSLSGARDEAISRSLGREDFAGGPYKHDGVIRSKRSGGFRVNAMVVPFLMPVLGEPAPVPSPGRDRRAAKIVGYKFNDLNSNGVWNASGETPPLRGNEPPLAGWTVTLSGPETQTATTDSAGRFEFTVRTPGSYTVTDEKRSGWRPTTPASVTVQVLLTEGETFATLLFGEAAAGAPSTPGTTTTGPGTTTTGPGTTTTGPGTTTTGPTCLIKIREDVEPKMSGGLTAFSKSLTEINRDDFIPLEAEGRDFDTVIWSCTPSSDCEETASERQAPLTSRVRFSWEITQGEGSFKKIGCLPDLLKKDEGEHVIFQPPYVPLPAGAAEDSKVTKIKLLIIDDNQTRAPDPEVPRTVTIVTTRKRIKPDKYFLTITSEAYTLPSQPPAKELKNGTCKAGDPDWKNNDDLAAPTIKTPAVTDGGRMVVGEMMILEAADQHETDEFNVKCESRLCTPTSDKKLYEDDVEFRWAVTSGENSGKILGSPRGRFILYQAPMSMPAGDDKRTVTIKCEVVNPFALQLEDKPKQSEVSIQVHNAGVRLDHPPKDWPVPPLKEPKPWIPEDGNFVELTSSLQHKDGGDWKPALAHQCRIHFLELRGVSTEPGTCMNKPLKRKADKCVDLQLKNEGKHEAFNPFKPAKPTDDCSTTDLFQEARTWFPVKDYKIKVHSRDFGSYGFLRSYANINTNPPEGQVAGSPQYYSIGVKASDVAHPQKRPKKNEYKDNRVTIPYDIDENHIADSGWEADDGTRVPDDPEDNKVDEDNAPVGDGVKGDGLSNYEEYRGFSVLVDVLDKKTKTKKTEEVHVRLNPAKKDFFLRNRDSLPIDLFEKVASLAVHQISEQGWDTICVVGHELSENVGDLCAEKWGILHVVNFNFSGDPNFHFHQRGVLLVEKTKKDNPYRLGRTHRIKQVGGKVGPAPPNYIESCTIFTGNIENFVKQINSWAKARKKPEASWLDVLDKIKQIVAHELLHACNVYHHGEPDPTGGMGPPEPISLAGHVLPDHNNVHGLRSGDIKCVMRYDNWSRPNTDRFDWKNFFPETIGNTLCTSEKGTGYNVNENRPGFGDANKANKRGNCAGQIRIRAANANPKKDFQETADPD